MKIAPKNLFRLLLALFLSSWLITSGQIDLKVISPRPDSLVPGQNLFVAVEVDSSLQFVSANNVDFYLDDYLINGITKVSGNKVRFVYPYKIRDGKHTLKIEAKFKGYKRPQHGSWVFYAGKKDDRYSTLDNKPPAREVFKVTGYASMDNREEAISGAGQALRQEPVHTRTVNIDAVGSYRNIEIPVKIFATTDNVPGIQSMNYFQVGFKNRWMEVALGDLNPVFDQLVLNGVRVEGIGIRLKSHLSSLQLFYGDMTKPVNGAIQLYQPGFGVLPTTTIDTLGHYIAPGVYRRVMMGARMELGSPKDDIRFCASVFKAKDDTNSIRFGTSPKDNIVGGLDVTVKSFHKALVVKAGAAMSILTTDITGGTISRQTLDTSYHVRNLPFDPMKFRNIIVLNASTLPANISPDFNNLAFYALINYTNKYQALMIDAKNIGPLYYSLGNPYLLNDYQGVNVSERFWLFKKKLIIGMGYENFANDLDMTTYVKVYSQGINGNITLCPGIKWPSLGLNYLNLARTGDAAIGGYPGIKDNLSTYMARLNYALDFLKLKHMLRIVVSISDRDDMVNPQNKYKSVNGMLGVSENLSKRWNISADAGRTVMTGYENASLASTTVYNVSVDWQIAPSKYFTSLAVSNNQSFLTPFSNPSFRFSVVGRFGLRFYKGMGIDVEGGYQPFIDRLNPSNNYNELYGYVRYSCDLGKLFTRPEPGKPLAAK